MLYEGNPPDRSNSKSSNNKRGNWGARFRLGRLSANSSNQNKDDTLGSKKSKKKQAGYLHTLRTPTAKKVKGARPEMSQSQVRAIPGGRSSSKTRPKSSESNAITPQSTQSTRKHNLPPSCPSDTVSITCKSNKLSSSISKKPPPTQKDTPHWTSGYSIFYEGPLVTEKSEEQQEQYLFFQNKVSPTATIEKEFMTAGGFEVSYDEEAESSRITTTTVSSVPTAATASETVSTKSSLLSAKSPFVGSPESSLLNPIKTKKSWSQTLSSNGQLAVGPTEAQARLVLSDELQDDGETGYRRNVFDPNEECTDIGNDSFPQSPFERCSSAVQLNLSDSNMQTASHTGVCPAGGSEVDGFRLVQSKSSATNMQFRPVPSTCSGDVDGSDSVLSSFSSLFPSSSAGSRSSLPTGRAVSSSSIKTGSLSPAAAKRKQFKLLLSRPFGRSSLPSDLLTWAVEVSPAEWDNSERQWKYRIQVSRQTTARIKEPSSPSASMALTWRSLESFVWLEEALTKEFQGGLLVPLLSIAVGINDLEQATHEVDAMLLRDWLSDILNGIRGQGELLLGHKSVDLLRSEAVEAFLFRNTAPLLKEENLIGSMMGEAYLAKQEKFKLQKVQKEWKQHLLQQQTDPEYEQTEERNCQRATWKHSPRSPSSRHPSSPCSILSQEAPHTFASSFWSPGPLALITDELCTGGCEVAEDSPSSTGSSIPSPESNKKYERFTRSSQALGTADTADVKDSFLATSTTITSVWSSDAPEKGQPKSKWKKDAVAWKFAQSTSLIQAERNMVLSYRRTALSTLEKLQVLVEEEENIGLAWRRFGIAVANLFTFEKEVEHARLGEKRIHRNGMPYRKVKRLTVDKCIKAVVQRKIDRSVPALRVLRSMLTAYIADLSAVSPSVEAYLEGMTEIAVVDSYFAIQGKQQQRKGKYLKHGSSTDSTSSQTTSEEQSNGSNLLQSWSKHLRSFTAPSTDGNQNVEQKIVRTSSSLSDGSSEDQGLPAPATELHKKRLVEDRVMANERLLRGSLTALCKSTTKRSARMAYAYFKLEAVECALLRSTAASLRRQIDLSDKETVSEMISRHHEENMEDMKAELKLAQRIVDMGKKRDYPAMPKVGNEGYNDESASAAMRDNALELAQERVGRWNSELAVSIMKAVGVDDPNVRVEETTRELRLVRKYAIGLRENLNRCIEAVDLLRQAVLKGGRRELKGVDKREKQGKHVGETRKEFFYEVSKLFSGVVFEAESAFPQNSMEHPSLMFLSKADIKTSDPFGWSTPFVELSSQVPVMRDCGSTEAVCGSLAQSYIQRRDSQTEWLLSSISGLLNEYTQRVEVVESFVYMECAGVQLEKHFSSRRTQALSAFEKKTDVTTAINIATRKRIPKLVEELKAKLEWFGPDVSHTSVKTTKEAHLESKIVKTELHELALRRLLRARETSTERVINLLKFWMKEEESTCTSEHSALAEILGALETSFLSECG